MLKYALTNEKPNRPKRVVFGLLSAEDIIRQSVVEVTQSILYYRGLPASGGLLDSLMGSVDRRHLCATCQRDARSCQGHSGHIKLSYPVYHGGHIDAVLRVLRCVCYGCSRVQTTFEDARALMRLPASARLQAAQAMLRTKKTCLHCGMPRPTFSRAPWASAATGARTRRGCATRRRTSAACPSRRRSLCPFSGTFPRRTSSCSASTWSARTRSA